MKTILKAGSVLALAAIMTSSCSVEYKTRHGKKHNAIDVGMNQNELQHNQSSAAAINSTPVIAVAAK